MRRKRKIRPVGSVLLDMEKLILEMTEDHELQWGDVLNLVRGYLEVHCPGAQEQYDAGGVPEFYYGPPKNVIEKIDSPEG